MTGDNTTQFYRFHSSVEAEAFLEALKHKGMKVRRATLSPDPDGEGGSVILAVAATSPD